MKNPLEMIRADRKKYLFVSYSALDFFFRVKEPGDMFLNLEASLIELARIFENLEYPGFPLEDASFHYNDTRYAFRCLDDPKDVHDFPFTVMNLLYDDHAQRFYDLAGIYPDIRAPFLKETSAFVSSETSLIEAARLVSRYHYTIPLSLYENISFRDEISIGLQRELLSFILLSPNSEKGLILLHKSGFIHHYWPEIASMTDVKQTKDYHPEGDVWEHTLETLKYRKKSDLTLSLALLFHDTGKPLVKGTLEKPFDGHSELGAKIASSFLNRLGFSRHLIDDVFFLIRYHMLPFGLVKLPLYRTEKVMESPLFPLLLEVYRADLSSSFWGPDGYYEACRVYRNYLRNKKNPYRKTDGTIAFDSYNRM